MKPRAAILTLGCRLNQADSALLAARLENAGYEIVPPDRAENLSILIVNSCAVTATAEKKSLQALRRLQKRHPEARVIFTGCAAETRCTPENSLILSNPEKKNLKKALQQKEFEISHCWSLDVPVETFRENAVGRFPFRSRALVKIQEGCNNYCTYCIVPYTRGRERSRAAEEILQECQVLLALGFPELVLTGVNVCAYKDGDRNLGWLLQQICALEGDFRIRLSSTEPHPDNLGLLDVMASEKKICRFLHLSLQHGSNSILERMGRHYTAEEYCYFAAEARKKLPGLHLGTDIIVGFPGESEQNFAESLALVQQLEFANLHLFTYSPRPGTPAASMPDQIPPEVARVRFEALEKVAEVSARKFAASQVGTVLPVIFEKRKEGRLYGWSDNYLAVSAPGAETLLHRIVPVKILDETLNGSVERTG